MNHHQARTLLERTIHRGDSAWADVGAGRGTFTRALAELLGTNGTVYAVERDASALSALHAIAAETATERAHIVVVDGDFTTLALPRVDGVLAANALHFVPNRDQAHVLAHLASTLNPSGRITLIEYDRERGNRWVPHPISRKRLALLSREAGFGAVTIVATTASEFGGEMYVAVLSPSDEHPARSGPQLHAES